VAEKIRWQIHATIQFEQNNLFLVFKRSKLFIRLNACFPSATDSEIMGVASIHGDACKNNNGLCYVMRGERRMFQNNRYNISSRCER